MGNWMGYSTEASAMNCWQYGESRACYCWKSFPGKKGLLKPLRAMGKSQSCLQEFRYSRVRREACSSETSWWAAEPLSSILTLQPSCQHSRVGLRCHTSSCGMLCLVLCGRPSPASHRKLRIPNTQSKAHKVSLTRQGAELLRGPLQNWRGYRLSDQPYPGHVQVVVK